MTIPGPPFEVTVGQAREDPDRHREHQSDDRAPRPRPRLDLGHLHGHVVLVLFVQVHCVPSLVTLVISRLTLPRKDA